MKSLKFLSLWVVPAFLAWWGNINSSHLKTVSLQSCPELACIDSVNVRLDNDCQLNLLPSMVVAPDLEASCVEKLRVEVFHQNRSLGTTIPAQLVGQFLTYQLKNIETGKECWGHVRVEDKTPPTLVCPKNTDWVVNTAYANVLTGDITVNNPGFQRRDFTCWLSAQTPEPGQYFYDTLAFKVATDGVYTFVLLHKFAKSDFSSAALFQGNFDGELPCQNIIGFTESREGIPNAQMLGTWWNDSPPLQQQIPWLTPALPPFLRMELELKKDQTYFLVTTSLKPQDTGKYAWIILRDVATQQPNNEILKGKTVYELPWITQLVCDDLDRLKLPANACYRTDKNGKIVAISNELRNILQLTGFPHEGKPWLERGAAVSDNCSDITVCVGDQIGYSVGDCDSTVVKRTFSATDAAGNGSICMQNIIVRKPKIKDVILPNFVHYIECDEEFPLDSLGFVHPSVTGYPFVRTAFGFKDLNVKFCNLAATYTNKARVDLCEQAYTFIREWTIYDWCNPGSTLIYNQLIKVGDFTPPTVGKLPKDIWDCTYTVSTGPFTCQANFILPMPDSISDNCTSEPPKISVDIVVFLPQKDTYGNFTGGFSQTIFQRGLTPGTPVRNVPKGMHLLRYVVEDACKNKRVKYYWFQVLDRNEPVAQCDDLQHITVGGQTANSSTRVYAADMEEGSYDDCGTVKLRTRREFQDQACANTYALQFYDTPLSELILFRDQDLSNYTTLNEEPLYYYPNKVDVYGLKDTAITDKIILKTPVFTFEGGKYYSLLNDYVDILCCDVRDSVRAEVWAFDDANMNGIPGDEAFVFGQDKDQDGVIEPRLTRMIERKNEDGIYTEQERVEIASEFHEQYRYLEPYFCAPFYTRHATKDAQGNNIYFTDIYKAYDDLPNGYYGCLETCSTKIRDRYNICWLDLLIEDKAKPSCKAPLDLTLACTDTLIQYQPNFTCADSVVLDALFGKFIAIDNCDARIICSEVRDERDNCGVGRITRVAYAEDASGNRSAPCQQVITVTANHHYEIKFPADVSGDCVNVLDTMIEVKHLACDLLTIGVRDERFSTGVDECFKIERTFSIINWCEYDGISDPIIISRDEDCDRQPGDEAVYVLRRPGAADEQPAFIDRNEDEKDNIPATDTKGRGCDGQTNPRGYWRTSNSTGYWKYTQFIKVYDQTAPEILLSTSLVYCAETSTCGTDITLPFTVEEACSFNDISFEVVIDYYNDSIDQVVNRHPPIRGQYPKYRYVDSFPIGDHRLEIIVKDGCNNASTIRTNIRVEDCKPPSPVCFNGLAIELMPVRPIQDINNDGVPDAAANVIWVNDFIASPVEDCSGPVTYSISRIGEIPDRNQTSLTLTCEDVGNTLPVAIYAWDNANNPRSVQPDGTQGGANYSFCLTYLLVQDNLLQCEIADTTQLPIAGQITNEYGVPVAGVEVTLKNEANQQTLTNQQGFYNALANRTANSPMFEIIPGYNQNPQEGISTFDLILINKHILGVQPLDSPYKMIAADVNNSNSISVLDVLEIRKLILSINQNFTKNNSWRFVDKAFVFPNPQQPWSTPFPELVRFDLRSSPAVRNADFIGVKIGDVNPPSGNRAQPVQSSPFVIQTADQKLEAGKTYQVPFAADLGQVEGYQFTLQFDTEALELTDIEYGVANAENFGWYHLEKGQITTSWHHLQRMATAQMENLFTLTFTSKTNGNLRDLLAIQSRPTPAEAYAREGTFKAVQLSFDADLTLHTPFSLYQNKPNPFSNATVIGFYMGAAATAQLKVYSTDGRLIKEWSGYYNGGYQEITIYNKDFPGAGVYYFTLQVNGWQETRKMLLHN